MIKIHISKNKQFYVTYHGRNGKVLTQSETFKTKANAIKNIKAVAKMFDVTDLTKFKIIDCTSSKHIVIKFD